MLTNMYRRIGERFARMPEIINKYGYLGLEWFVLCGVEDDGKGVKIRYKDKSIRFKRSQGINKMHSWLIKNFDKEIEEDWDKGKIDSVVIRVGDWTIVKFNESREILSIIEDNIGILPDYRDINEEEMKAVSYEDRDFDWLLKGKDCVVFYKDGRVKRW